MIERDFSSISLAIEYKKSDDGLASWIKKNGMQKKWKDLLSYRRILIVSEAGMGKTFECQQRQKMMWNDGEAAFFFELSQLAVCSLEELLSGDEKERLDAWKLSDSDLATFFLDSIDELSFTLGEFKRSLLSLSREVEGLLHRVRIVITSRPVSFDSELIYKFFPARSTRVYRQEQQKNFAHIVIHGSSPPYAESDYWCHVQLNPLTLEQAHFLALQQGVSNADALIAAIEESGASEFSQRPQEMLGICSYWKEHAALGKLKDQVDENINFRLQPRESGKELAELSLQRAREGASRLALAALLSRKLNFNCSGRNNLIVGSSLDVVEILDDWNDLEIKTLLQRAIFGFVSYGLVRFHHSSVIHFLAAERLSGLIARGTSTREVKRLVFGRTCADLNVVKPSMRPVAAWLGLNDKKLLRDLVECDPSVVLFYGDPASLTLKDRQAVIVGYVGGIDSAVIPRRAIPQEQSRRLATPALASTVNSLWLNDIRDERAYHLLLDLILFGSMTSCSHVAIQIALDVTASDSSRMKAISTVGKLKVVDVSPLALSIQSTPQAWPHSVAFHLLSVIFPRQLSLEGLFVVLQRLENEKVSFSFSELSSVFKFASIEVDVLQGLCDGLTQRMIETAARSVFSLNFTSRYDALVEVLSSVCLRLVSEIEISKELAKSCLVATRRLPFAAYEGKFVNELRRYISSLGDDPKNLFTLGEEELHADLKFYIKECKQATTSQVESPSSGSKEVSKISASNSTRAQRAGVKIKLWETFQQRLLLTPQRMFEGDNLNKTLRMLWIAGPRNFPAKLRPVWNLELMEALGGCKGRELLEIALGQLWRGFELAPNVVSDKNFGLLRSMQIAALLAELSDKSSALQLTQKEARQAILLTSQSWYLLDEFHAGFYERYKDSVCAAIEDMLSRPGDQGFPLLAKLNSINMKIGPALQKVLMLWLGNSMVDAQGIGPTERQIYIAKFLADTADDAVRSELKSMALESSSKATPEFLMKVWIPVLLRMIPEAGVELSEKILSGSVDTLDNIGVIFFSMVFSEIEVNSRVPFPIKRLPPDLFYRLVKLALIHVGDKTNFSEKETTEEFSFRKAEAVRDRLLLEFLDQEGREFWKLKLKILEDEDVSIDRGRVKEFVFERAALQTELVALSAPEIRQIEKFGGFSPATQAHMFQLLCDRISDLKEMLLEDASPRKLWGTTKDESALRSAIARELFVMANGLYTVDQESVTVEENETDIRLRSSKSPHQAVIEIKVGDNHYSIRDLVRALRDQLVGKYMAAESTRSGCLLITLSTKRSWKHPDTQGEVDFDGLIKFLNEVAQEIMDDYCEDIQLTVVGLDLRSRPKPSRES